VSTLKEQLRIPRVHSGDISWPSVCTRILEGSGKDRGIAWQRKKIPFLGLCRLQGKRTDELELLLK
jgi:hypothetical protein